MIERAIERHARDRRVHRDARDVAPVRCGHRHRDAHEPREVLLVVGRQALPADRREFGVERAPIGDRLVGESRQREFVDDAPAAGRRLQREQEQNASR